MSYFRPSFLCSSADEQNQSNAQPFSTLGKSVDVCQKSAPRFCCRFASPPHQHRHPSCSLTLPGIYYVSWKATQKMRRIWLQHDFFSGRQCTRKRCNYSILNSLFFLEMKYKIFSIFTYSLFQKKSLEVVAL